MTNKTKNILVCNDDGADAKGLQAMIEMVMPYGNVIVVVPELSQSGMSHSISITKPIRAKLRNTNNNIEFYTVPGTPADCIKLALNKLCKSKPDLVVSGINHGSNSAISVIYSGTMGAAIEASLYNIPAIGISVLDHSADADFSLATKHSTKIIEAVLKNGLPANIALNVNFPIVSEANYKGLKVCRQTKGFWSEDFDARTDPYGGNYYWLTGNFENTEPDSTDTDEWALKNGFGSIVPVKPELTDLKTIEILKNWNIENE